MKEGRGDLALAGASSQPGQKGVEKEDVVGAAKDQANVKEGRGDLALAGTSRPTGSVRFAKAGAECFAQLEEDCSKEKYQPEAASSGGRKKCWYKVGKSAIMEIY